jgi:hypothetical protein
LSTLSEFAELQSALENVAAQRAEIMLKIKRRQMVKVAGLERHIVERAHSTRDSLLYAPARHAAPLAAAHCLDAALVFATLTATMRATLTAISKNGPTVIRTEKAKANGST